jgi:hypothetical protein
LQDVSREEEEENWGKDESFNCSPIPSPIFNFKEIPFMTAALGIVGSHPTGKASNIQSLVNLVIG